MKKHSDKLFWLFSLVLGVLFIYLIIRNYNFVNYFPLGAHTFADLPSYLPRIHFLIEYGFHQNIPLWYNGAYTLLKFYPPGYFFFVSLFYNFMSLQLSTYVSMIVLFALAFGSFLFLGRILKFYFGKTLFFYLFFFLMPTSFIDFFVMGRYPMLYTLVFVIGLFGLCFHYLNNKLDWKFLVFGTLLYALILLGHSALFILSSFLLLGLFLSKFFDKNIKESFLVVLTGILSLLISLFWLIPSLDYKGFMIEIQEGIGFGNFVSVGTLVSMFFIVMSLMFVYYYKKNKLRDEFLKIFWFVLPSFVLCILYLTRLVAFIPFLQKMWPDGYNFYFLLFGMLIFLFVFDMKFFSKFKEIFVWGLIFGICFVFAFIFGFDHDLHFEHSLEQEEMIYLLSDFEEDSLFILYPSKYDSEDRNTSARSIISYANIFYNIKTPAEGWLEEAAPIWMIEKRQEAFDNLYSLDCVGFEDISEELEVENIFGWGVNCERLKKCGFELIDSEGDSCVYFVK